VCHSVSVCLSVCDTVCVPVCLSYRQYTSDYKLETYLKVARLYLEDEDPVCLCVCLSVCLSVCV